MNDKQQTVMEIFFASDNNFVQHLSVAIASILKNSKKSDFFNFYILNDGINEDNKNNINLLKQIKNFNIEYIPIQKELFKNCKLTKDCGHIPYQTYFRYLIPKLKPELKKCFYFDCDIVINNSLSEFWNIDLKDKYVAVVEELCSETAYDCKRLNIDNFFNAGILLINNELWVKDNISDQLFENTIKLANDNILRWQDQDVLNWTFKSNVLYVGPEYNLQQNAFWNGTSFKYSEQQIKDAIKNPVIIHYNGSIKPWQENCPHGLWKQYYKYLKITPFKEKYRIYKMKKIKSFIQKIFSIINENNHKVIRFCGLKLKIKRKIK